LVRTCGNEDLLVLVPHIEAVLIPYPLDRLALNLWSPWCFASVNSSAENLAKCYPGALISMLLWKLYAHKKGNKHFKSSTIQI